MVNPSIHLQLQHTGDEHGVPRVNTAPHGVETPTWGSYSQRPAPPGRDTVPSPDQKFFHTSTTPTNRGRQRWSSGSIPPRTVWKPQPHWLIADWLGFVSHRHPESIRSHPRNKTPSLYLRLQLIGDESGYPPGRYRPVRCENPNCGYTIVSWGS